MSMKINKSDLGAALRKATSIHESRIGHNDQLFIRRIYDEGIDKYIERLQAIGFTEHSHVLDAGCGYGQWSLAMAEMNKEVSACDISQLRIDFLGDLVKNLDMKKLDLP